MCERKEGKSKIKGLEKAVWVSPSEGCAAAGMFAEMPWHPVTQDHSL